VPLDARHGPEKGFPGYLILPDDKAVYSHHFFKDTESYTQEPVSRQTQPTFAIDFDLHPFVPDVSKKTEE
jgi:hypothetical protein